VTRLLSHYWTSEDHPAARQAQLEDWIADLEEFGAEVVIVACQMWRRANSRRPTPADVRELCMAEREYRRPIALPPPEPPREEWQPDFNWRRVCAYEFRSCQGRWDGENRWGKTALAEKKKGSVCYRDCEHNLTPECRARLSWNQRRPNA
jgi:hypothetical protein